MMKRVALITGGSRGIGFGIAKQLAENGFDIAINGVRPIADVKDAIEGLKKTTAEVLYCQGNIASHDDRTRIIKEVKDHYRRLHVLVNNAGIAPRERADILMTSEKSFDEVLGINLKGTYFLTQEIANWMVDQKRMDTTFSGCIINITSISATVASVNRGEYCISKAGLGMVTQLFAARLGEFNIPVYEVRPGIISTDMTAGVKEKYDTLIEKGLCVQKRWGQPEDVGKAVNALAQGNFPYSTGQVVMVDGGLTVPRL
jgi:3-oxoacyl-[acyl-carrier protein] reductase